MLSKKKMKAILKFNLLDEEDLISYKKYTQSEGLYTAVLAMDNYLRNEIKYNNNPLEEVREKFREILSENNITLDF
jgi:hypothetical protein